METGIATKEPVRFTCFDVYRFVTLSAGSPAEVDKKNHECSSLIVQGTAASIVARRIKRGSYSRISSDAAKKLLKIGVDCTIEVYERVRIVNATYQGRKRINQDGFWAFIKNGVAFWVYEDNALFTSIGGKKL